MKKRTAFLIFFALILGAVYAYKFTDWFAQNEIHIKYRKLPGNSSIMFYFVDEEHSLTSLKVISVDEAATNKYPHALWHLVPVSNAVPVTDFVYGISPSGMKPKIAGLAAEPLQGGSTYRLIVETEKLKGEKEFLTHGKKL